jgi:hypothetical protein
MGSSCSSAGLLICVIISSDKRKKQQLGVEIKVDSASCDERSSLGGGTIKQSILTAALD